MTEDLKLTAGPTSAPASAGCACCAPADTASTATTSGEAVAPTSSSEVPSQAPSTEGISTEESGGVQTSYEVIGMTCGHCVSAVRSELNAVPGVREVDINLVVGGASTVTVTSDTALELDVVAGAVDEAGYELAGQRS